MTEQDGEFMRGFAVAVGTLARNGYPSPTASRGSRIARGGLRHLQAHEHSANRATFNNRAGGARGYGGMSLILKILDIAARISFGMALLGLIGAIFVYCKEMHK